MSQVRKFYRGGKGKVPVTINVNTGETPENNNVVDSQKAQGTFTIDGKTYSGPGLAEDLERTGAMYSPYTEHIYRSVADAIRNGQSVVFDSKKNIISGMDGKWGLSEKDNDRLSNVGRSSFWNGIGSMLGTNASKIRDNLRYLGQYVYNKPADQSSTTNANNDAAKRSISGDRLWFNFSDGKYLDTDEQNLGIARRLKNASDLVRASDEDRKNNWTIATAYNSGTAQDLLDLYKHYGDEGWNRLLSGIEQKVRTGNDSSLTPEELAALKIMKIYKSDDMIAGEKATAEQNKINEAIKAAGYNPDEIKDSGFYWDDSTKTLMIDDPLKLGFGGNGNYHFNDDWTKTNYYAPKWNFLKNKVLLNGHLYNDSDAGVVGTALYNKLHEKDGYFDLASSGRNEEANNIIKHFWTEGNNYIHLDNDHYSNFLSKDGRMFRDVTHLYEVPEGQQLVEWFDEDPSKANAWGEYNPSYAYLDKNGMYDYNGETDGPLKLIKRQTPDNAKSFTARKILHFENDPDSIYNGRYVTDSSINNETDMQSSTFFYVDPNNPSDLILHMPELENKVGGDIRIPKEIGEIFLQNKNILKNIENNRALREDFIKWLIGLTRSEWGRGWGRLPFTGNEDYALWDKDWDALGFTRDQNKIIRDLYKKYVDSSDNNVRQRKYIVHRPVTSNKNGGVLKMANGDVVWNNTTVESASNIKPTSDEIHLASEEKKIGDGQDLTSADWMDVGAFAADLASLGLSLTGVGSLASAGVGAAGSLARFGADTKRDGFQWTDAGNLLLNLGMDAVTALPVVGNLGKAGKLAKLLKQKSLGSAVLKVLGAYGAGSAAYTAAKKIVNGEQWSFRDLSTVANGLNSAIALHRTGILDPVKQNVKTGKYKGVEIGEFKGKKLELSGDEVKAIATKETPKERINALAEKLKTKVNDGITADAEKASTEDILNFLKSDKATGITSKFKLGHEGWKPKVTELDFAPEEIKSIELRKQFDDNEAFSGFRNWWNGRGTTWRGKSRDAINLGGRPIEEQRKLIEDNRVNAYNDAEIKAINAQEVKKEKSISRIQNNKTETEKNIAKIQEEINALTGQKEKIEKTANESIKKEKDKSKKEIDSLLKKLYEYESPNDEFSADLQNTIFAKKDKLNAYIARKNAQKARMRSEADSAIQVKETTKDSYAKSNKDRKAKIEKLTKELNALKAEKAKTKASDSFNKAFKKGKNGKREVLVSPYRGWINPYIDHTNKEHPDAISGANHIAKPTWKIGIQQPAFKNGGIIKAEGGASTPQIKPLNWNRAIAEDKQLDFLLGSQKIDSSKLNMPVGATQMKSNMSIIPKSAKQQGGDDGSSSNQQGGISKAINEIDPSKVINAYNAIRGLQDSRHQFNNLKDYRAAHAIAPILVNPRFQTTTGDAIRATISSYRKPVTSDARLNTADQFNIDQQNQQILQKANFADSQAYGEHLNWQENLINRQRQIDAKIANENAEADNKVDFMKRQFENQMIAQNSDIRNKYLNAVAYDAHNRWMAKNQLGSQNQVMDSLTMAQQRYANAVKPIVDAWTAYSTNAANIDPTTGLPKMSFNQWAKNTGNDIKINQYKLAFEQAQQRASLYSQAKTRYGTTFDFKLKEGGKIGKSEARVALDKFDNQVKMLIAQGKVTSKFISDLNSIIKSVKTSK